MKQLYVHDLSKWPYLNFWVIPYWVLYSLLSIAAGIADHAYWDKPFDLDYFLLWDFGVLLWIPTTWFLLTFCRGLIKNGSQITKLFLLHIFISFFVATLQILFESLLNMPIRWAFFGETSPNFKFLFQTHFYGKILQYIVGYWVTMIVAYSLSLLYQSQCSELKASLLQNQLSEAKLYHLKVQLQPHFLFNAHNTIMSMIHQNKNAEAGIMLGKLSDLLRTSLAKDYGTPAPLSEELDILKLYLEIQQERFQERLNFSTYIPDSHLSFLIPPFILQPIVENAIKHGIGDTIDGGMIEISSHEKQGYLLLLVQDDGAGLPEDFNENSIGLGLSLTKQRLEMMFGAKSKLIVCSREPCGTAVSIEFPLNMKSSKTNTNKNAKDEYRNNRRRETQSRGFEINVNRT